MSEVAFATYQQLPVMTDDDRLVADILDSQGITVSSAVWDAPNIDWLGFACVVLRSTWNYHLKPTQYANWLQRCSSEGIRLWNPPALVLANLNKQYLTELAANDIAVVPTTYLRASAAQQLRKVLERCELDEAVIKPAVSASAYGTWRTSLATADADQAKFEEQTRAQDVLIQPYLSEVASQGEWSLVFFNGEFSHAVLKRPAAGDFRVHREFGGSSVPADPPPNLVKQAQGVLAQVGSKLLYARVDGIERDGRLILMELEMNEPFLFLGSCSQAAERFANAIRDVI